MRDAFTPPAPDPVVCHLQPTRGAGRSVGLSPLRSSEGEQDVEIAAVLIVVLVASVAQAQWLPTQPAPGSGQIFKFEPIDPYAELERQHQPTASGCDATAAGHRPAVHAGENRVEHPLPEPRCRASVG